MAIIAESTAGSASPRDVQKRFGIIDPVDAEARFSKKMGMPAVPARDVEHSRSRCKTEQLHQTCNFLPVALE
jgi:hypothetical protein